MGGFACKAFLKIHFGVHAYHTAHVHDVALLQLGIGTHYAAHVTAELDQVDIHVTGTHTCTLYSQKRLAGVIWFVINENCSL